MFASPAERTWRQCVLTAQAQWLKCGFWVRGKWMKLSSHLEFHSRFIKFFLLN